MAKWTSSWSSMHTRLLLLLLLCGCMILNVCAEKPAFSNMPYVESLNEWQDTTRSLVNFTCTDPDSDATKVTLVSVNPASPCADCFVVVKDDTVAQNQEYRLMFYPTGTLDYKTTSRYTISVVCTDGNNEPSDVEMVEITIIPDTPPRFTPNQTAKKEIQTAKTTGAGEVVYRVEAIDDENDDITYSLTASEPSTDNFEIGSDGVIRTTNSLASECNSYITFTVSISDKYNDQEEQLSVGVTLKDPNIAPDITNVETTVGVPEDTAVGSAILNLTVVDDDENIDFTLSASPPSNLAFFEIDQATGQLRVKSDLDYENNDYSTRETSLTIVASDGNCESEEYSVYVTIDDVNEPPDIYPKNSAYSVYEGFGVDELSIPWSVQDEDDNTHIYSIIAGNDDNWFSIDSSTGKLSVNIDYDIDNGAMPTNQTLTIAVTDDGVPSSPALTNSTDITLHFKDANDNAPVISTDDYEYSVCDTRSFSPNLGTMSCTDEDTSFEGNNATCFESNGSAGVTVTEDGRIVMLSRPPLDTTYTVTAYCRDRCTSTSPTGQLRSSGRTVTVYTTECTTTIITDTPTTEETTLTTTAETTTVTIATTTPLSTENVSSWADKNVWWIALAALLGTALLGLLMYMWLMYCWKHCGQCLERQWCQRKLPEPRRTRMKQPIRAESPPRVHYPARVHTPPTRVQTPLRRLTPSEKPTRPSPPPTPPPPPPAIVGDPNARGHDFWKERYPDDDYSNLPDRKDNPRPVTP